MSNGNFAANVFADIDFTNRRALWQVLDLPMHLTSDMVCMAQRPRQPSGSQKDGQFTKRQIHPLGSLMS